MKLVKLTMHNFLSYLDQEVDFSDLDYCAVEGSNGSGKSSIFQAICWAIYGKTRIHGDKDSVVNDQETFTEVSLDLEDTEGQLWRIVRSRNWTKGGTVRIHIWNPDISDWEQWGDHQNSTAEQQISEIVGIGEDAFFSLVMLDTSEGSRFTNASSNQRRNILLGLLPELNIWSTLEYRARDTLSDIKEERKINETRRASLEEEIKKLTQRKLNLEEKLPNSTHDELNKELKEFTQRLERLRDRISKDNGRAEILRQLNELERDRNSKRERAISRLDEYDKDLGSLKRLESAKERAEERKENSESRLSQIKNQMSESISQVKASEKLIGDLNTRIGRLSEERQRLLAQNDQSTSELEAYKERLEALGHTSSNGEEKVCWVCGSSMSEEQLHTVVHEVIEQIKTLEDQLTQDKNKSEDLRTRSEHLDSEREEHQERLLNARKAFARVSEERASLESSIESADERLEEIQEELHNHHSRFQPNDALRERIQNSIARLEGKSSEELELREQLNQKSNDNLLKKMEDLEADIDDVNSEIEQTISLNGGIREHEKSLERLSKEVDELKKEYKRLIQSQSDAEALVYACSAKGVPSIMLDEVLQDIQDRQNDILAELPGIDSFSVKFQRKKQLKSKDAQADILDIVVRTPRGWERSVDSLSSGEKVKITLSNIFAMVEFFNARNGRLIDVLLLDEPLGTLDQEVIPAVIEALIAAMNRRTVSKIMVITHDHRVIDALPQQISVTRTDEAGSKIEVMS